MNPTAVTCPECGSNSVQGQLVATKNVVGGLLTALFTEDMAASVLVAQDGRKIVQAFCLTCGASWLPTQDYMVRALRGELGDEIKDHVYRELWALVVSKDGGAPAKWARSALQEYLALALGGHSGEAFRTDLLINLKQMVKAGGGLTSTFKADANAQWASGLLKAADK